MIRFKEIDQGVNGLKYIQEHLSTGSALSASLLNFIKVHQGNVTVSVPNYVTEEDASNFGSGILVSRPKKRDMLSDEEREKRRIYPEQNFNLWHELANNIQKFLKVNQRSCCILENSLSEATDPWIGNAKSNIVTHDKTVYHFLSGEDSTEQIIHALGEAASTYPPAIGALISDNDETAKVLTQFHNGQKRGIISLNQLKVLAEDADYIFVEAYDGEGYVMWQTQKV